MYSLNKSQRHQFFENGISWIYTTHTCYNYRSFMVEYFVEKGQNRDKIARPPNFQYRWGFKSFGIPFPEDDPDFPLFDEGNGSWIIVPGWLKHTSHLAQNAIFINHHLHYMNSLPPVFYLARLIGFIVRCDMCFSQTSTPRVRSNGQKPSSPFLQTHIQKGKTRLQSILQKICSLCPIRKDGCVLSQL